MLYLVPCTVPHAKTKVTSYAVFTDHHTSPSARQGSHFAQPYSYIDDRTDQKSKIQNQKIILSNTLAGCSTSEKSQPHSLILSIMPHLLSCGARSGLKRKNDSRGRSSSSRPKEPDWRPKNSCVSISVLQLNFHLDSLLQADEA